MRRSLRDSIVGFSLFGGILIFTFFSFWLRGVRLSSKNWHLFAEFKNASGLSKKSPVTYRGILVGSIEDILFTNETIKAKVVLNNPEVILPKPAFARVVTNSFLGGDVQVALETSEKAIPKKFRLEEDIKKFKDLLTSNSIKIYSEEEAKELIDLAKEQSSKTEEVSDDQEKKQTGKTPFEHAVAYAMEKNPDRKKETCISSFEITRSEFCTIAKKQINLKSTAVKKKTTDILKEYPKNIVKKISKIEKIAKKSIIYNRR